ncbi:polysaccharide transport protein [Peribacillus frigoritolerans]|uniref:lipopolysaccharide biosynthesis protein n=1 Tax=Peribacillus frigoritolerans TaxID=450367 RepID=UPI0032B3691A
MRSKKAIYNLIANLTLQIITSIIGIILPKLFIEAYGSNVNGMVSSINQFLRYLSLVEAGLGAASIASLYGPLALKNTSRINEILSASRNLYIKSGYIFAALTIGMALIYPLIIRGEIGFATSSIMVLILAGSGLVEYFIVGKYRVLLIADQKSYVISMIQSFGVLLNAIVAIIFIKAGFNVILTQSAATLVFISRVFFIVKYVKVKYPNLKYNLTPDLSAIDRRWDAFIQQFTNMAILTSPIIIITIFCSLSEVSVYVIYSLIFTGVNMILSAFSNGFVAGFGQIIAKKENDVLRRNFNKYEYIYYILLTWTYTCALLLILPFIEIYTNNISDTNYIRPIVAILFVVVGVSYNIRIPHSTMINAGGLYRETKFQSIIEASINLISSLILVQFFGIIGVLLGSLISNIYRTPEIILFTSKHITKSRPWKSLFRIILMVILGGLSALPFIFVFEIEVENIIQWLLMSIIVSVIVMIVILLGNMIFEYAVFKEIIKQIFAILKSFTRKIEKR